MLTRTDFLSLVLPATGQYCVVGLKKDAKPKQIFVSSVEEIDSYADALVHRGYDAYFALASFTDDSGRTTANASHLNSFFLDLDCGLGKPYADQSEGVAALKDFVKKTSLPRPTAIVNSGRGVHAYWVLEEALEKNEWRGFAEGLKALCVAQNLHADPAVTADVARILRIPDTLNFKNPDDPQPVKLLMAGARVGLDALRDKFVSNELHIPGEKPFQRQIDPTTLALLGNYQSRFKTILLKSVQGEGCAQLAHIYENQDTVEEPLWRAGLSIAHHCVDAGKAIHILSNKHPEYDARTTEKKAAQTKGPYTCDTFKKLSPALCEGCSLKVTSPIQIGREVIHPDEDAEAPVVEDVEPVTQEVRAYTIPKFPFPFFRGHVGGIYLEGAPKKNKDGTVDDAEDTLIFPHDFYVVKRLHDPEDGECVMMRLHLPKDGVREFILPLQDVISKDKFMSTIAKHGVAIIGKKQEAMMLYATRWVEELQAMGKAEIARKQFGWLSDDSAFILGEKEIRHDTVDYSPPSAATLPLVPALNTRGDFHVWKDVINHYSTPGMELRAFALFMGWGGPLMKFVAGGALNGFLLNLVSKEGGTGKSTLLQAINSVYGNPDALMMNYKDTHNFRLQRFGILQNITATIDELTNMKPELMSDLVYDITSGKGKGRMSSKANVERINNTTWQLPVVSSSNKVIRDALLSIKSFPEPELLRILEANLAIDTSLDAVQAKQHFGRLASNYGHAIIPFIQYVQGNLPAVIELLNKVNEKIDRAAGITSNERFWSAGVAIDLTGGIIAGKLGLHDIPIKPVMDYAVELIKNSRRSNKESMFDSEDFLGAFLQRHFHEILVINGSKDNKTGLEHAPIREPRGPLTARYEPDTKLLFVAVRPYREECSKYSMSYDGSLDPYEKAGAFLGMKRKRMFAGTVTNTAQNVQALVFDASKLGFFDEEILLNAPDSIHPDLD
jgi:hypothetical protein